MELYEKGVPDYQIHNPNFDWYFDEQLKKADAIIKGKIPAELSKRLFRKERLTSHRLNFQEKMYILNVVLGCQVVVVIDSKNSGDEVVGLKGLGEALKVQKGKLRSDEFAEELQESGLFVIGDKEVMEAVAVMRLVCCGPVYRSVIPAAKRKVKSGDGKYEQQREAYRQVVGLFRRYEAGKRRIAIDYGLNIPEWYALLHYFFGENTGPSFYENTFALAHAARKASLANALTRLSNDEYLLTRGKTQKKLYRLSPKGERVILEIFDNVVFK